MENLKITVGAFVILLVTFGIIYMAEPTVTQYHYAHDVEIHHGHGTWSEYDYARKQGDDSREILSCGYLLLTEGTHHIEYTVQIVDSGIGGPRFYYIIHKVDGEVPIGLRTDREYKSLFHTIQMDKMTAAKLMLK